MKILFFAHLQVIAGCNEIQLPAPAGLTENGLWSLLETRFPGLAKQRPFTLLARNCAYASKDCVFCDEDEVALIPPVSGG